MTAVELNSPPVRTCDHPLILLLVMKLQAVADSLTIKQRLLLLLLSAAPSFVIQTLDWRYQ